MTPRGRFSRAWVIWSLIATFALVQAVAWTLAGGVPRRAGVLAQVFTAWAVMLTLAWLASRRIGSLSDRIREHEHAHQATMSEIEQLQTQNAMLQIIAQSVDVTLAFQALASRIARLVACDRVGLALLDETGQEFQTYTARVHEQERRTRPRPEVVFKTDRTLLGNVVRTREPIIVPDIAEVAGDFLDANVLQTAGFSSVLMVPLMTKGRAVGTLNLVARQADAFLPEHAKTILPIAELFAVAVVAQQLQMALGRHRSVEAMSDLTLGISAEINSALQTIIGHCDLLERGYPDPNLQRDLATVIRQAQRIAELLDKMRIAAHDRLKEVEAAVAGAGIPASPEGFGDGVSAEQ
jgi:transcriptional regulator with GAF, ATPase, and Fis domain